MTGTSPPGPLRCGSTTCSVKAVATAASKALPPFSRIDMPTAVAIQCVDVTTPKVPSISGRVVKGFGLMLLMGRQDSSAAHAVPRAQPGWSASVIRGQPNRGNAFPAFGSQSGPRIVALSRLRISAFTRGPKAVVLVPTIYSCQPRITAMAPLNYVSQNKTSISVDYADMPANAEAVFVNTETGVQAVS